MKKRLKKVLDRKKKAMEEEKNEKLKQLEMLEAKGGAKGKSHGQQGGNLLDEEHDEDLLFK